MKIAVCFKIVPDYEELSPAEWKTPGEPDFSYVKKMYGCFDEAALELGLRLKDSLKAAGIPAEAVALTAGAGKGAASEQLLKTLYAAGYDELRILPETDPFDPKKTAEQLAAALRRMQPDCLFTGRTVGPGDSGSVPYYLAKALSMPLLSEAADAFWHPEEKCICLVRLSGQYRQTLALNAPCLAVAGDTDHPVLRLYSLRALFEAARREIKYPPESAAADREGPKRILFRPAKEPAGACRFPEAETAADQARFLMEQIREAAR